MKIYDADEEIEKGKARQRQVVRRRFAHKRPSNFDDPGAALDNLAKQFDQPVRDAGSRLMGVWFWCWGLLPEKGKNVLLGPYPSEDEAFKQGQTAFEGSNFEVVPLHTRDSTSAARMLKARRVSQEKQLIGDALKTIRHKIRYKNEPGYTEGGA